MISLFFFGLRFPHPTHQKFISVGSMFFSFSFSSFAAGEGTGVLLRMGKVELIKRISTAKRRRRRKKKKKTKKRLKSLEGKERLLYEKKRKIKGALEEGKPIPTELRNEEAELRREINLEDENTAIPKTNIDDEYASASEKYPKILVTTSRNPSAPLTQFVKELKFVFPNAQRMNRGGQVTRHDIKDKKSIGTMPEAYPHLILNNFSTKLGQRTAHILKHLFPVPKPDTKRIITFANQSDYSSFRPNPSMHLSRRFYSSIDRKIGYHDQATMRLHMGIDFHHWLIVMKEHEDNPIDGFIETLAVVVGSKEEAQQKIYSVSTGHYNAFGARISEKIALQILALPRVRWVMPDFYVDCENKLYGGRPYVNGQVQYGVRNF